MGLSIRAYAKRRGVSHVAVMKAVKAGRIALEADGSIDPARADAQWDGSTDPARGQTGEDRQPVSPAAMDAARRTLKEQGLPSTGSLSYIQARTAHEIAKGHLARLRLAKLKGELVDRDMATGLVFRLAREERDAWLTWPARVAAIMAAELGVDAHALQTLLDTHVRAHLAELSVIKPEFT